MVQDASGPRPHSPVCRAPGRLPLWLRSRRPGRFPGGTISLLGHGGAWAGGGLRQCPCNRGETVTSPPGWGPPGNPHVWVSYLCLSPRGPARPARRCCCSCWWTRHGEGSPGATWGCRDPVSPPALMCPRAGGAQRSHRRALGPGLLGLTPGGCHQRRGLSCKAPGSRPFWWGGEQGGECLALGCQPPAARRGPGAHWAAAGDMQFFPPPRCPPDAGGGPPPPGCRLSLAAGGKQPRAGLRCHPRPRPLHGGRHWPCTSPSQPSPLAAGWHGGPCAREPGGPGARVGVGCGVLPPRCPSGSRRRCRCSPGPSPPRRCR